MSTQTANPRIVVIGAGPTGLGAAWRLEELGFHSWCLFEAAPRAGGLAASVVDDQGFTWDLGCHVVFSHYEYFDALVDDLIENAWCEHVRESWIWLRERFVPYPFQSNLWRLPEDDLLDCLKGLIEAHRNQNLCVPVNFGEWILQRFGPGIANLFLFPYNAKVWAYEPQCLGTDWLGERVAEVDLFQVIRNVLQRRDDVAWGPNAQFRYPRVGGAGAIWEALSRRLPQYKLNFGASAIRISTQERVIEIEGMGAVPYDFLVSSVPLDRLVELIDDRPNLSCYARRFRHTSTHAVGIGMTGEPPSHLGTKSWIYFPEDDCPFHRIAVLSNFSPNNVPMPGRQWSLLSETSESRTCPRVSDDVVAETLWAMKNIGLIPEDSEIVSAWHSRLEYGYPTPFLGRDQLLDEIQPQLEAAGILSRGRFGSWKYEVSNQDHSLMQGVEAIDRILLGTTETTVNWPDLVNARRSKQSPMAGNGDFHSEVCKSP